MLRMLPYLGLLSCRVKIVDFTDSGTLRFRRALPWMPAVLRLPLREELRRVERYELQALLRTDEGWVVAEPDRKEFVARVADARVTVVPNGVVTRWGTAGLEGPKGDTALFLGNLTVSHNRDAARHFANDIWPRVRARRPGAVLRLVGRHDGALRDLASCPGVRFEGFVEDLTPLLRDARVAASPLRFASGLQNKVLETMAAGLPSVVPSTVNEAIGAPPGEAIVVADGADAIAAAIVAVMDDPVTAARIGAAGSAFVRERFSWSRSGERLSELLHHAGI
jgi:glycosyltransferase involved in cell wall biosynthesis